MPKQDRAVITARDIIDRIVCECGHVESEHAGREGDSPRVCQGYRLRGDFRCRCVEFRPVRFTVERVA